MNSQFRSFSKVKFCKTAFNIIDFVALLAAVVELFSLNLPVDPTLLRLCRLAKLFRRAVSNSSCWLCYRHRPPKIQKSRANGAEETEPVFQLNWMFEMCFLIHRTWPFGAFFFNLECQNSRSFFHRTIRVLRVSGMLDSLSMLARCMSSSGLTLIWSLLFLLVIQLIAAMMAACTQTTCFGICWKCT